MASSLFCCSNIPHHPPLWNHEAKFNAFVIWAKSQNEVDGKPIIPAPDPTVHLTDSPYAIRLVRQRNYEPQEWIRYFVPLNSSIAFHEVYENDLIKANFERVNSYMNFQCHRHNTFFEINLYQRESVNQHHWSATIARPAAEIDVPRLRAKVNADAGTAFVTFGSVPPLGSVSPTEGSTRAEINSFTRECLQIALPRLRTRSIDDLLCLVALDIVNCYSEANADLSPAWARLSSPWDISDLVVNYGILCDIPSDSILKQQLDAVAHAAMELYGKTSMTSRDDLIFILTTMAKDNRMPCIPPEDKLVTLVEKSLDFARDGSEIESPQSNVNIPETSHRSLPAECFKPRDPASQTGHALTSMRRFFRVSDYDDMYSFSEFSSPRDYLDYTACSMEDCGYCGRCDC